MPLPADFLHHLHELMVEVSERLHKEAAVYKRKLIFEAQQKNNSSAVLMAYKEAALHAYEKRVEETVTKYLEAADIWGLRIDDSTEQELLVQIGHLLAVPKSIQLPPGLAHSPTTQAMQSAYALELERTANGIRRNAANRLREAKVRSRKEPTGAFQEKTPPSSSMPQGEVLTPPAKKPPTAFISYSWDSDEHKDWVMKLATSLRKKGVDVTLDQWHLRFGADRAIFMERSILESDFVLIVCTPSYAEKGNKRVGGAGYEAMVITGELARKIDNSKFIPLLRSGEWEVSSPNWLRTKMGADLRGNPYSVTEFERLLRDLHQQDVAPPLGQPPPFHQESAEGSMSAAVVDFTTPRSVLSSADWERLSDKLSESCRFIRADSQRRTGESNELWRLAGAREPMCETLLRRAGAMLLRSPRIRTGLPDAIRMEPDDLNRWLEYLKYRGCHEQTNWLTEDLGDGRKILHTLGHIKNLKEQSTRVCMENATAEL